MEDEPDVQTNDQTETATTGEETIDATVNELIRRIDDLTNRVDAIASQVGGYDNKFGEFEQRFSREQPSERHWYFKSVKGEVG